MNLLIYSILWMITILPVCYLLYKRESLSNEQLSSLVRNKIAGSIIGLIVIFWSAHYAQMYVSKDVDVKTLFEQIAHFTYYFAPILVIVSYFYLDYILIRFWACLLIMLNCAMLNSAFAEDIPVRWLFSAICYLILIIEVYACAQPWRFRHLIRDAKTNKKLALKANIFIISLILIFLVFNLI